LGKDLEFIDSDPFFKEIRAWATEEMERHPLQGDTLPPEAALESILTSPAVRDPAEMQDFIDSDMIVDEMPLFDPESDTGSGYGKTRTPAGKAEPRPRKKTRPEPAIPRPDTKEPPPEGPKSLAEKPQPSPEKPHVSPRSIRLDGPFKLICHSPILATMSGTGASPYRFLVSAILGTVKAEGTLTPQQPNTICFEIHPAPGQQLVMSPGESWMLQVLNETQEEVFSYQFTIDEEDIANGSKSLTIG